MARPLRGTIAQCEPTLTAWQAEGFAPHVMMNETDGTGRLIGNVTRVRSQLVDLDGPQRAMNYARLVAWQPAPHMFVNTSPGKYQAWFLVQPHTDKQLATDNQRRLAVEFQGDPQFIDVAHTARLPGFWHLKAEPFFSALQAGPAWGGPLIDAAAIAGVLAHIDVKAGANDRQPLGSPTLAAPSWEWLVYALHKIDPNGLSRQEWISVCASFKQAGWQFGEQWLMERWQEWCAQYRTNSPAENVKNWNSIQETAAGWAALVKTAGIAGELMFQGLSGVGVNVAASVADVSATSNGDLPNVSHSAAVDTSSAILTPIQQQAYFDGCYWIDEKEKILTPSGRLAGATMFNGKYGGKIFQLDLAGSKVTDEPWKAATRGQVYNVPKVDHMRFIPTRPFGELSVNEMGGRGVNSYRPINTTFNAGDVGPFTAHCEKMFPIERDRAMLYAFLAQCIQRPGVKIKWAIVIQSMEGTGKTIFQKIMSHGLGSHYVHSPNAKELTEGGGKFNAWIRNKLMIIVNEIKTDEKFDLIEVLKPMITDEWIETQAKGADQTMSDNWTNWLMFTNWKDALPINDQSRRLCIMYSALQSIRDLQSAGMDGAYFTHVYKWLESGGASAVCHWLSSYAIPAEFDGQADGTRAPHSSSHKEAIEVNRGAIENLIVEAVQADIQGFRNGWVSTVALGNLISETGMRNVPPRVISSTLANLGYRKISRATKAYRAEISKFQSTLYNLKSGAIIENYASDQGYFGE